MIPDEPGAGDAQAGPVPAAVRVAGAHVRLPAAVDQERVARLDLDALGLRDLLQLPALHGPLRRDVRLAPVARHVEQHAAGDDAVTPCVDRAERGALRGYLGVGIAALPHPVAVPHVAERVDMGHGLPVVDEAVVVDDGAGASRTGALAEEVLLGLEGAA